MLAAEDSLYWQQKTVYTGWKKPEACYTYTWKNVLGKKSRLSCCLIHRGIIYCDVSSHKLINCVELVSLIYCIEVVRPWKQYNICRTIYFSNEIQFNICFLQSYSFIDNILQVSCQLETLIDMHYISKTSLIWKTK